MLGFSRNVIYCTRFKSPSIATWWLDFKFNSITPSLEGSWCGMWSAGQNSTQNLVWNKFIRLKFPWRANAWIVSFIETSFWCKLLFNWHKNFWVLLSQWQSTLVSSETRPFIQKLCGQTSPFDYKKFSKPMADSLKAYRKKSMCLSGLKQSPS